MSMNPVDAKTDHPIKRSPEIKGRFELHMLTREEREALGVLRAAYGRRDHRWRGAYSFILRSHLPGKTQQACAGIPAGQAGDGYCTVFDRNPDRKPIHGDHGAGDLGLRSRACAL